MHDISDAEPVFKNQFTLIGYVKEAAPDLWVPIDIDKMTIAGPTGKDDAVRIVHINSEQPIQG